MMIENVPELQVGGNVIFETDRVPKMCRRVPKIQNLQNWMNRNDCVTQM